MYSHVPETPVYFCMKEADSDDGVSPRRVEEWIHWARKDILFARASYLVAQVRRSEFTAERSRIVLGASQSRLVSVPRRQVGSDHATTSSSHRELNDATDIHEQQPAGSSSPLDGIHKRTLTCESLYLSIP